jgi:hypothetical protein
MHEIEISLLRDLVVVFGCAAPVVYLFHQFKQSPIVGFVITGAIVEMGLRLETGVLILGIVRENRTLNNPDSKETIHNGDLLVLSGTKDQLKKAILMLSRARSIPREAAASRDSTAPGPGSNATKRMDEQAL